jgi:Fe-S cluster assembly ATPase SufC
MKTVVIDDSLRKHDGSIDEEKLKTVMEKAERDHNKSMSEISNLSDEGEKADELQDKNRIIDGSFNEMVKIMTDGKIVIDGNETIEELREKLAEADKIVEANKK